MVTVIWVAFFGLFLIILAWIAISYRRIFVINNNYGTYSQPFQSQCSAGCTAGSATVSGVALQIQTCQPNTKTGYGCLVGDQQTYRPIISTVPCTVQCPSAMWQVTATVPCQFYTSASADPFTTAPVQGCVVNGSTGLYPLTGVQQVCVAGPGSGPNTCVLSDGTLASVGMSETVVTSCPSTGPSNPQCGTFLPCISSLVYRLTPATQTSTVDPLNLFHEGVVIENESCIFLDYMGALRTDQTGQNCLPVTEPCRPAPTPFQVQSRTIPNPQMQRVCGTTPRCFGVGRKYPTGGASGILAQLLNRPSYLMAPSGVVAPSRRPITVTDVVPLAFLPPFGNGVCTAGQIFLNTGLVVWFSPDVNNTSTTVPVTFTGRLAALIDTGTLGWLVPSGFATMQPAYLTSDMTQVAPGANWLDAAVVELTITSLAGPSPPPEAPYGTSSWIVSIAGLTVQGQTLNNVVMYLLPPVLNPTLDVPLNERTTDNPCNLVPGVVN